MMHSPGKFKVISETSCSYIGYCECCYQYNFAFNNLLIVFSEDELINFLDWLQCHRSSTENFIQLPHGRTRIYSSPHGNLFLVFNEDELDEINVMAAETKLMLQATRLINPRN